MAKLSAAEKQRLYRQRRDADPDRRAAYLKQKHQTYLKDLEGQKRKRVKDLTKREKREEQRKWRVRQAKHRERLRAGKTVLTPPSIPDSQPSTARVTMATPGSGGDSSSSSRPAPGGRGPALNLRAPGRLPTMRSRDLTLGGVKKKTFTPNIIGRKTKEELKVNEGPRRERRDADRGRQRDGRGRGRGRPEVIQSHSIFEQGPAEGVAKRKGVYEDTRDTPNSAPCPIINIKKEYRETEEETKEILRKLERDNFVDDPQLKNEARCCPVQLPLAVSGWVFKEEEEEEEEAGVKVETKCEEDEKMIDGSDAAVTVKQEPPDVPVTKKAEPLFKPPPLPEPDLLPDLLQLWSNRKEEELLFIQLPDSLPGQPPTSDARPTKTTVESEDGQSVLQKTEGQEGVEEEENTCHLRELQEGLVGRLLVRKSGRVQLVLGKVTLDVALGTSCSFLQELVSVTTEGRRGDMMVLGHLQHKLVCSPDFEALLQNRA